MKFFLLATNGRSGSHFLHSLIDNHKQIASFPGIINLKKLELAYCNFPTTKKFIRFFIKEHIYFFNSKRNKESNFHKLGKNKNEFFIVDQNDFEKKFFNLNKMNNNFEIIIKNLHLAYYNIAHNVDVRKIKCIFIHVHNINDIIKFNNFKCEVFYSYRHPISIINSGTEAFIKNKKKNMFNPKSLYFYLLRVTKEPFFINSIYKINIIKLENLHLHSNLVLKNMCKIFKVKFMKTMRQSTFMGKLWWGDSLIQKQTNSFNKNFKIKINKDNFYPKDIYFFQRILEIQMKKLNYKKIYELKVNSLYLLLPLKIEEMLLKNLIKDFKFKEILYLVFYYFKRVNLFIKYFYKKRKIVKINII